MGTNSERKRWAQRTNMHAITERFLGDFVGEDNKGFIVYSTIPGIEALVYAKEAMPKKIYAKEAHQVVYVYFWVCVSFVSG